MFVFGAVARRVVGTRNDRLIKRFSKAVEKINALEDELAALDDAALSARTVAFKERLAQGETLDDLTVEAFATVREASKRTLGLRHFDVQLIGGMVLHQGSIAEMKTGEGKTLVATLAVYLNALSGQGVHVVTVNDYLAQRDADWMRPIYEMLGLKVGVIVHNLDDAERREAYAADVTYGTNNEFAFDYLRDNNKFRRADMVHRDFQFAIVDEVDSILIDEARTPLIISGPTEDKSDLYVAIDKIVAGLEEGDFEKDEKDRNVQLTEDGTEKVEALLREAELLTGGDLYDFENTALVHHVTMALRARQLFERDTDYIVKNNKVVIIDEFTGRMMEGRRWSGGQHQAVEAKEGVPIQPENQTLASVTFQNFFRMYPKLAGMTGTAATEAGEFMDIYGLDVVEIPTNVPVARADEHDEFYRTAEEKYRAIAREILACRERGQPVLVGTVSIEKSELLSQLLKDRKFLASVHEVPKSDKELKAEEKAAKKNKKKKGQQAEADAPAEAPQKKAKVEPIPHQVLNARHHDREAHIVAQAGRLGAVTIATNMAGRGTDIQLGGNLEMRLADEAAGIEDPAKRAEKEAAIRAELAEEKEKVKDAGGLYIIGTERHESRRIDNQLRGRAGRQGDPGRSKFYLSLQDDMMRIFGPERMDAMLVKLGIKQDEAIIHPWLNKAIERAQSKVEARNFEMRKQILKYDDVMNDQRRVIFEQRLEIMDSEDVTDTVADMRADTVERLLSRHIPPKSFREQWDVDGLTEAVRTTFGEDFGVAELCDRDGMDVEQLREALTQAADDKMHRKAEELDGRAPAEESLWKSFEKSILLQILDQHWKDHLQNLDHLRQAVGLRAYAQRDPLNEYKADAFNLFEAMLGQVREKVTQVLATVQIQLDLPPEEIVPRRQPQQMEEHYGAEPGDPMGGEGFFGDPGSAAGGGLATQTLPRPQPVQNRVAQARMDPNDPSTWGRVARNAPCPCGSGKKYKHCHGALS